MNTVFKKEELKNQIAIDIKNAISEYNKNKGSIFVILDLRNNQNACSIIINRDNQFFVQNLISHNNVFNFEYHNEDLEQLLNKLRYNKRDIFLFKNLEEFCEYYFRLDS